MNSIKTKPSLWLPLTGLVLTCIAAASFISYKHGYQKGYDRAESQAFTAIDIIGANATIDRLFYHSPGAPEHPISAAVRKGYKSAMCEAYQQNFVANDSEILQHAGLVLQKLNDCSQPMLSPLQPSAVDSTPIDEAFRKILTYCERGMFAPPISKSFSQACDYANYRLESNCDKDGACISFNQWTTK